MIQRIQTLYLALAAVLSVVCCMLPLAVIEPREPGFGDVMYSLVLLDGAGGVRSFLPAILFGATVVAEIMLVAALFSYMHRVRQMALCVAASAVEVVWVAAYVFLCLHFRSSNVLHVKAAAFIPVFVIVLSLLARRRIKKDDELVRSADRIR